MDIPDPVLEHRDFVYSIVITALLGILLYFSVIDATPISPSLAAAIFTVIIGTTGTLFSILIVYEEIIKAADNIDYLDGLKRVFVLPVQVSVLGFIISIVYSTFNIQVGDGVEIVFNIQEWSSLLTVLLLLYAVLSFRGAFLFTVEAVIQHGKKNLPKKGK